MPQSVVSSGGKQFFDDDQVTPDTQVVCYEYPGLTLVWEHRTWSPFAMNESTFGVEFHGAEGVVTTDGRTWWVHRPKRGEAAGHGRFDQLRAGAPGVTGSMRFAAQRS